MKELKKWMRNTYTPKGTYEERQIVKIRKKEKEAREKKRKRGKGSKNERGKR